MIDLLEKDIDSGCNHAYSENESAINVDNNEEAIKRLKEARNTIQPFLYVDEAIDYAIKVLEQKPKTGYWIYDDERKEHGHCSSCGYGSVDLMDG